MRHPIPSSLGRFSRAAAVAAMGLLFSSCLTYYPDLIKAPLFAHRGESRFAAYLAKSGVEASAAHAVSDHYTLMGSISTGFNNGARSTDTHVFGEIGMGRFDSLGGRTLVETFVGGGFGQSYSLQTDSNSLSQVGNYLRGFVSSDIAYDLGWARVGAAARFAAVEFVTSRSLIDNRPFGLFIEPAVFGRVGWDRLKFDGQIGMSWHILSNPGFGGQKLFCGIGVQLILPTLSD